MKSNAFALIAFLRYLRFFSLKEKEAAQVQRFLVQFGRGDFQPKVETQIALSLDRKLRERCAQLNSKQVADIEEDLMVYDHEESVQGLLLKHHSYNTTAHLSQLKNFEPQTADFRDSLSDSAIQLKYQPIFRYTEDEKVRLIPLDDPRRQFDFAGARAAEPQAQKSSKQREARAPPPPQKRFLNRCQEEFQYAQHSRDLCARCSTFLETPRALRESFMRLVFDRQTQRLRDPSEVRKEDLDVAREKRLALLDFLFAFSSEFALTDEMFGYLCGLLADAAAQQAVAVVVLLLFQHLLAFRCAQFCAQLLKGEFLLFAEFAVSQFMNAFGLASYQAVRGRAATGTDDVNLFRSVRRQQTLTTEERRAEEAKTGLTMGQIEYAITLTFQAPSFRHETRPLDSMQGAMLVSTMKERPVRSPEGHLRFTTFQRTLHLIQHTLLVTEVLYREAVRNKLPDFLSAQFILNNLKLFSFFQRLHENETPQHPFLTDNQQLTEGNDAADEERPQQDFTTVWEDNKAVIALIFESLARNFSYLRVTSKVKNTSAQKVSDSQLGGPAQ